MILLAKVALGAAGVGLAAASLLCSEGFVQVRVVEKQPHGRHMDVIAPAMLAPIAARLAPRRELARAESRIQPNLPVIRAALDGLRDVGNIVLVQVNEPNEHVQVSKSGSSIVVDVDSPGKAVYVSAPIRAVSSTVDALAASDSGRL